MTNRPGPVCDITHTPGSCRPQLGGWQARVASAGMLASVVRIAARCYPDPTRAAEALRRLVARSRWFDRGFGPRKPVRVGDRWFMRLVFPGWPGPAFDRWAEAQFDELLPWSGRPAGYVATALIAVTSRCPLACAHCSAANELGPEERTPIDRWIDLVRRLQERGLAQLHLTGGEPMVRFDDVLRLLGSMSPETDTWIDTSGVGLNGERARALADVGLTGVAVSLDDWRPAEHDRFRGREGTFDRAAAACRAASDAGLVVAVSLVPRRETANPAFLERYADLAEHLGASFLRIVEPKAVGRWAGQDVALGAAHREALERFEHDSNTLARHRTRPVVVNHDRLNRDMGCLLAGDRGFYVDAAGYARSCPFCTQRGLDVLGGDLGAAIAHLRGAGCSPFRAARTFDRFPVGIGP